MNRTRILATPAAVLLSGSIALGGLAALPARAAAATAHTGVATVAAATAATATITVTPSTANRGGIVTVTGSGFRPSEKVTIALGGVAGTAVTVRADKKGVLPPTGLSIPYGVTAGKSYTITATGATSKATASSTVMVQELTPSLNISNPSAMPGNTITVHGSGFGRRERVTLALNSAALTTNPAIITTTNGAFTASFVVPSSLLAGANTISALGNESRVSAVASLNGSLTQSTQFYIAGGENLPGAQTVVMLLNTNRQPASVKLNFYTANGNLYSATVDVSATSQQAFAVSSSSVPNLPQGTFGVAVQSDRQIAAELNVRRPGQDGSIILGNSGLDTFWYLAAGTTTGTAHESLAILNPDPSATATVQLQLVTANGQGGKVATVTVPAHSEYIADINALLPNRNVSIIVRSDHPVAVERTLTFGPNGAGMTGEAGTDRPATSWLFASGTTENGVQTVLSVLNPGDLPARVTASFFKQNAGALGSATILVPGRSRGSIRLNSYVQGGGISSVVTSDQPVVVERSEYAGSSLDTAKAGSVTFGRNGAGVRWTFPGGNTDPNHAEVLVLYNPSIATVPITATFYDNNGNTKTQHVTLAPGAYDIMDVNVLGLTTTNGAVLQSGNGQGFIAEQGVVTRDGAVINNKQGIAQ